MTMSLHLQTVPARNGLLWMRHGFKVLQRRPLGLTGLYAMTVTAGLLLPMLLPPLGFVTLMALPLVSLGFMLATHLVLQKLVPTPAVFIAPLKLTPERRKTQLWLGLIYALLMTLAVMAAQTIDGGAFGDLQELMQEDKPNQEAIAAALADPRLFWGGVTLALLVTLISAAFWHAPALVHWGGQGLMQALFSSCLGVWRNKAAFALNGLAWIGLLIATSMITGLIAGLLSLPASLMGMLALTLGLVLSTAFYSSLYFSFVDCFMFGAPRELPGEKQPPGL
jgi:hypothetical protein